ncbi:HAD-like domain-containing protein [Fimicolochytrium jonesii]|uniref:HAD-like domain-containing protein n=1 Tax=Fimicolochytrium jonesii TaxID=1396493 RepID=UPI0022FE2793|nr:HAD-like domain-containing protein [Fimicolochytrium jonesii]KAI8827001.1 HAD-like domain-containing protein [Fimicolochytrium jonesii]
MDGVLMRGGKAIPGARKALERLQGDNPKNKVIPFIVLTNSGGELEAEKARKLSNILGIEVKDKQVLVSHSPMRELVPDYKDKLVHVVGPTHCKNVAHSYGFRRVITSHELRNWNRSMWPFEVIGDHLSSAEATPFDLNVEPISAVMIMHDSTDWGLDIQLITDSLMSESGMLGTRQDAQRGAIKQGVPVFSSNPDFLWSNDWPLPRFGQGAFVRALDGVWRQLSGNPLNIAKQYGKPSAATYDYAKHLLSQEIPGSLERVYMVGDNPKSDIAGANANGWVGVLVESGVYRKGDSLLESEKPKIITRDVLDAVDWILQNDEAYD